MLIECAFYVVKSEITRNIHQCHLVAQLRITLDISVAILAVYTLVVAALVTYAHAFRERLGIYRPGYRLPMIGIPVGMDENV